MSEEVATAINSINLQGYNQNCIGSTSLYNYTQPTTITRAQNGWVLYLNSATYVFSSTAKLSEFLEKNLK